MRKRTNIYYDQYSNKWSFSSRQSLNRRKVYWGASPVPMNLMRTSSPPKATSSLPMSARIEKRSSYYYLGPLLGILTTKGGKSPFAGNKKNFIDLSRTGKQHGAIVFVFTPDDVHWENNSIHGSMYDFKKRTWKRALFPLPNVVYNRVPTRKSEALTKVQSCITRLKSAQGVTLFNPHFFNKQELFTLLQNEESIRPYLPDTKQLQSKNSLLDMLNKHKSVYLKPTKGKAGAGIIKVAYNKEQQVYTINSQKGDTPKILKTRQFDQVWRWFQTNKYKSPYLIQQAINLHQIKHCPFDFRVLLQKNNTGQWEVTGIGTRVAGVDRITTHVPRGGRIENPTHVLNQLYPTSQASMISKKLKTLAITIAKALEGEYSYLGEMSMDIGLDTDSHLWFFEANSKPMKFDEPTIRSQSLKNIIGYAQYKTFGIKR
ncbi:YheC/YheD family protein [Caldalkalibacillus salinus]|uniref:YheC/YheD family endospore coat-associated protein n=1 Tax=Caldalkalibacillus salinus TaxID=2803787 RepID=UPI0019247057|nr:YheC/YheD family protein [Caldalkalibacillus salinus]